LALGTTYDPLVIQRLGVLGAPPDLEQARQWYQRAAELGSNSASQRLARLAAAP
jgi:TPR repeat protein